MEDNNQGMDHARTPEYPIVETNKPRPQSAAHRSSWTNLSLTVDWYTFYLGECGEFPYRQDGREWKVAGLCPMHADHKPGSFYINVTTGAFKCHSCGAGGNAVTFVIGKYGVNVKDAIRHIKDSRA